MSDPSLGALEGRVKGMIRAIQKLKGENEGLEQRLAVIHREHREWRVERGRLGTRLKKILKRLHEVEGEVAKGERRTDRG